MLLASHHSRDLYEVMRQERCLFAAKIRIARAVLGWSQTEFASRAGLTQRAVHKLEQGDTEPRRTTVRVIEEIWRELGIEFDEIPGGGFSVHVPPALLERTATAKSRRQRAARIHLGVTAPGHRSPAYRS